MGFIRHGQRADVNLNELEDDLVALQFAGLARNIRTTVPERGEIVQDVARARVFTFKPDGTRGEYLGETLVFQSIISQELQDKPGDWHLGIIRQREQSADKSRTVYTLEAPEDSPADVFGRMESELNAAGVA